MQELIKQIIRFMLRIWISIPYRILQIDRKKNKTYINDTLLKEVLKVYEKYTDYYYSYHLFPKKAEDYVDISFHKELPLSGVVIQGPLCLKDHFTLETVRLYKKIFSQSIIIVSTWIGEDQIEIKRIEDEGVIVVQSEQPECCGLSNVNYQFVSSYQGIKMALDLGCQYVFKVRSDQRIFRNNVYEELFLLLKQNNCESDLQNERIVVLGGRSGDIFWPLHLCDFFFFGEINDMLFFFDMPLSADIERFEYKKREPTNATRRYKSIHRTHAETFIFGRYFDKLGIDLDYSIKQHWEIVSQLFITLSENDLNLLWMDKYDSRFVNGKRNGLFKPFDKNFIASGYNFDYFKWNIIRDGLFIYNEAYEEFLEYETEWGYILDNENNQSLYLENLKSRERI